MHLAQQKGGQARAPGAGLGAVKRTMGWRTKLLGWAGDEVRPSIEKRLEAGTVLFRAGDSCQAVALIHDGEIELLADRDGQSVRVGTRGRGTFVGDDEVLGDGIWRRTARALCRTRVEMLARDVYLERFVDQPWTPVAAVTDDRVVHLLPASPESARTLLGNGIEISDFPFVVGRAAADVSETVSRPNTLLLEDRRPYHLSRRQFVILRGDDGLGISDPGSRLGTFVAGRRLGPDPLPLPIGRVIEVSAGGVQSPFRFQLRVE